MARTPLRKSLAMVGILLLSVVAAPVMAAPSTAAEIDAKVDAALERLKRQVRGSDAVLARAHGVLVFAEVLKAGLMIAGEGGEGAMRVGGKTTGYYSIFSGSVGLQAGAQKRDIIMIFLEEGALKRFQDSKGWKAGVDGTVTLIDTGATGTIDSATLQKPIVAFIVGQKGLMAGVSLDGSKISKIER